MRLIQTKIRETREFNLNEFRRINQMFFSVNPDHRDPSFLISSQIMVFTSCGDLICENFPLEGARHLVRTGKAIVRSSEAISFVSYHEKQAIKDS